MAWDVEIQYLIDLNSQHQCRGEGRRGAVVLLDKAKARSIREKGVHLDQGLRPLMEPTTIWLAIRYSFQILWHRNEMTFHEHKP